ncbi:MAG: hypothetical protein KC535_05995, partial [Nanoarchaeota archaeon]|nr:hypothetical protein [Nanoarchaeota archaeon]
MDSFDQQKKEYLDALYKPDRSKKGNVDEHISSLLDTINNHSDFYTTSSCSGRIMLIVDTKSKDKSQAKWLFVSHDQVTLKELEPHLKELPQEPVWFRLEGMILHVCARTFDDAKKFLIFAQNNGYKHAGILSASKRFIVQIMGVNRFDAPIADKGALLVKEEYFSHAI